MARSSSHGPPPARGLAGDGDMAWIAAESGNVSLHPFERGELVEISVVAELSGLALPCQLREGKEAKSSQPVVETDKDNSLVSKRGAVVDIRRCSPLNPPSAVYPDHDRQFATAVLGRPDVDVEAVF